MKPISLVTILVLLALTACAQATTPAPVQVVPAGTPNRPATIVAAQTTIAQNAPTPTDEESRDLPKCAVSSSPIPTSTPQPTPGRGVKSVVATTYVATYKCIDNNKVQTLVRKGTLYTFEGFQPKTLCPQETWSADRLGPFKLKICDVESILRVDVEEKK